MVSQYAGSAEAALRRRYTLDARRTSRLSAAHVELKAISMIATGVPT